MRIYCLILIFCLTFPPLTNAQQVWRQTGETQPTMQRGAITQATVPVPAISDSEFRAGTTPKWIWGEDNNKSYVLSIAFDAAEIQSARLVASCDNVGVVFVNGQKVASSSEWQQPMSVDVTQHLSTGRNTIEAEVENQGGVAAFVLKLVWKSSDGSLKQVVTDEAWEVAAKRGAAASATAKLRGTLGDGPWGQVFDNASEAGRVPNGTFEVLPGYVVDKLFTVPRDELGSWVCIAFDNKGRLLASDQGDKGICRITLPVAFGPVAGRRPSGSSMEETIVERLDFSQCEFKPSGAQGMLWAFDSLYFCCNGGPGSGLYRARDIDGDDQFDECVKLKEFRGGGEHGPHSIRLSPDGKRIFVIAGNHTQPPFNAGEELKNKNYSSRVPTNWGEDLLLPRMWDANGHARGVMAPGGWIASTDPDGKTWDIWSIGYRNPYDMAFNADGELFAYDADMEWDVGTPWYRPTRVVHATSGSEFGWRSGTGKWPDYYFDSLPALVNIGPGSPVGVDFGYGLKFPAKYQKALYICDWTFGTMYAIHLEPNLSSYKATKEEFVARNGLPLTDVAAGPDGALYFTVGGRGTQSELYRVTYLGTEDTEPTKLNEESFARDRRARQFVEKFHGLKADLFKFVSDYNSIKDEMWLPEKEELERDRVMLTSVRRALQNPSFGKMLEDSFNRIDANSQHTLDFIFAMTRGVGRNELTPEEVRPAALRAIQTVEFQALSVQKKLDYLRTLSMIFIRLGEPTVEEKQTYCQQLDEYFPSDDWRLNRELCQMLVYLDSPMVVAKTIDLMNAPPQREEIDMGELLTRNRGYGSAIKAMIDNQPDKNQMWYALCLRAAKMGWSPELRADYYRWFGRAQQWSGGNSFKKFLQNIEQEAWDITPFDDRILVERAGARTPYKAPQIPKPSGPGKEWTLQEVRALAADGLTGRSFENGQKMFAATRCILCHRFAGDGGATGPDLTQLAGRFNVDALTEAILDPSKVISDQYKASTVVTTDGKSFNGRIVSENTDQISVLTDPEDSTRVVDIPRSSIDEILPSMVSIMPQNLLKPLNSDEVLDLLAYLLSRGHEKHPMFRK